MGKNWKARDRKHKKKKHGMKISGRSILDIVRVIGKRAKKKRRKKDE